MTAPNDEGPTVAAATPQEKTLDSAILADGACLDKPERKRLDTLAAHLALRGYELHTLTSGEFLVSRWGLRKFCRTLADVEDFARQAGALR